MSRFRKHLTSWLHNERAAFAVYAAVAFPILLAMLGFGLDYWTTLSMKARLDAAADAAAVAGVKAATVFVQTYGTTMSGAQLTSAAVQAGTVAATQAFKANAGPTLQEVSAPPAVTITYANRTFTGVVSFNTSRPAGFAGIVGMTGLGLGGSATAAQKQLTYINVYVLVDTSQSMGIATNQTQMNALYAATAPYNPDVSDYGAGVGCVFGCHVAQGTSITMEQVAHNNNIQLRIDTARQAIYNMVQSAQTNAVNNNIKFAVYSMQQNPNTGTLLAQVYPTSGVTSNYSGLLSAMAPTSYVLDLGSNNSGGTGDSNQTASLAQLAVTLPIQGDGSSAGSPLNYVYVITDGALDTPGACTDGHCTQAMQASACDTLKATGATVGIIYTTYINIYAKNNAANGLDNRFSPLIAPFVGMISGNLSSCASGAGWYYQATDDTGLLSAMDQLFQSTLSVVKITN